MVRPTRLPENEESYLEPRQAVYRTTPNKEKDSFVEVCARHLLSERGIQESESPEYKLCLESLCGKVRNWFNNRSQAKKARLPLRVNRAYKGESVYEVLHRDEIKAAVAERPTSAEHSLPTWNACRRELWRSLTDEEREAYEEKALQWNREGPDVALPPSIAHRRAISWMRTTTTLFWEQCRMPIIIYGLCPNGEEDPQGIRYDTSELINERAQKGEARRPEYTDSNDWDRELRRTFRKFFQPWILPDAESAEQPAPETTRRVPVEFAFEEYDDGTPILVGDDSGRAFSYLQRIDVFRQYMRNHYSCARGFQVAFVPWAALRAHQDKFFEDGMLPVGFRFTDPSHIAEEDLITFFRHVIAMEHPSDGSAPRYFRFRQYCTGKNPNWKFHKATYDARPTSPPPPARKKRPVYPPNARKATTTSPARSPLPEASSKPSAISKRSATSKPSVPSTSATSPKARKAAEKERKARERAEKKAANDAERAEKAASKSQKLGKRRKGKGKRVAAGEESDEAQYTDGREEYVDLTCAAFSKSDSGDDDPEELGFQEEDELVEGSDDFFDGLPAAAGPSKKPKLKRTPPRVRRQPSPRLNLTGVLRAPAAFSTTPDERWLFLSQVTSHAAYLSMLERASEKIRTTVPATGPYASWASWTHRTAFTPIDVHQDRKYLSALQEYLSNGVRLGASAGAIQGYCLAMGLLLRDIILVTEIEDDENMPDEYPPYFAGSNLLMSMSDSLLDACSRAFHKPMPRRAVAAIQDAAEPQEGMPFLPAQQAQGTSCMPPSSPRLAGCDHSSTPSDIAQFTGGPIILASPMHTNGQQHARSTHGSDSSGSGDSSDSSLSADIAPLLVTGVADAATTYSGWSSPTTPPGTTPPRSPSPQATAAPSDASRDRAESPMDVDAGPVAPLSYAHGPFSESTLTELTSTSGSANGALMTASTMQTREHTPAADDDADEDEEDAQFIEETLRSGSAVVTAARDLPMPSTSAVNAPASSSSTGPGPRKRARSTAVSVLPTTQVEPRTRRQLAEAAANAPVPRTRSRSRVPQVQRSPQSPAKKKARHTKGKRRG